MTSSTEQTGAASALCEDAAQRLDYPLTERIVSACVHGESPFGDDEIGLAMRFRKPLCGQCSGSHRKFPLSEHLDA